MKFKKLILVVVLTLGLVTILGVTVYADCTDMIIGKDASVDGSVMTSHTGCCGNFMVHVVPAQTFRKGTMAPVYYGMQDIHKDLHDYGEVIGEIPQVEQTFAYFHTGYPQMSEHQLAIGETTTSQKIELRAFKDVCKQIMTIEQAELFAHQRCKTAREAIKLITSLVEKYGFLPSCCGTKPDAETLCIADPNEAWVLEVFSVGNDWDPESGELGAIWAAQRVPDDHAKIVPNCSTIREIDLSNPDYFMASKNYMQVAIDHGWYDPNSGKPFIWQEAYAPPATEGNLNRLWLFYSTVAPNLKRYHTFDPVSYYPFSVKPEKKLSVHDIMTFQRSTFEGTIFDMTADLDWFVSDRKGGCVKSPFATPFATRAIRELLDITWHRPFSCGGYGFVSQSRSWLPDPIGGVYWFYLNNQALSTYVPIYAGVQKISPLYQTYDSNKFSEESAKWVYVFVETLVNLRYQDAIKDLRAVRDPLEDKLFAKQSEIDKKALELYKEDPMKAKIFLTDYTQSCMEEAVKTYQDLRYLLITKYNTARQGTYGYGGYRGDDFEYAWPR